MFVTVIYEYLFIIINVILIIKNFQNMCLFWETFKGILMKKIKQQPHLESKRRYSKMNTKLGRMFSNLA